MTKKNFVKVEGSESSSVNAIVKKLADCEQKKSDHNNGYYIVAETWGTCFFRISKTRDHIEIEHYKNPTCDHTYTKIPEMFLPNVFFAYVNLKADKGFILNLPAGGRIIGMHDPQPSKCGKWLNYSFLIYSPDEVQPSISEHEKEGFWLQSVNVSEPYQYTMKMLCPLKVRHMYINDEGFVITKANWKPIELTQHIDKSVEVESDLSIKLKEALEEDQADIDAENEAEEFDIWAKENLED